MAMGRVLGWLAVCLLAWSLPAAAGDVALRGEWRPAASADLVDAAGEGASFDPSRQHVFRRGPAGAWVSLHPRDGRWPDGPFVVSVVGPGLERVVFHPPDGGAAIRADSRHADAGALPAHGRLAFPVSVPPPAGQPLRLRFEPIDGIAASLTFAVQPVAEFHRTDARWLAFASASFAVMLGMAVVTLLYALWLRDPAFAFHAGYVLSYALVQAVQTGYAFQPLGWEWVAAAPRGWGRGATIASVMLAILFLSRFASLGHYAPGARRVILWLGAIVAVSAALGFAPVAAMESLGRTLLNPLLMICGPAVLVAAWLAWRRGSRYAGFFLIGWSPLLALTALGSAQLYGVATGWNWVDDAALAAGAFEALVLTLGLAERTLGVRRDREQARTLADIDPLTSLPNRRALERRLDDLIVEAERSGQPLCVLFLDLDHFKSLNDHFGHAAGDRALVELAECLRSETRARDVAGRWGGEEFLVALPDCDAGLGLQVAERVRQRLERRAIEVDAQGNVLTVSIGLAIRHDGERRAGVIERADRAMYAAKGQGRNWVSLAVQSYF